MTNYKIVLTIPKEDRMKLSQISKGHISLFRDKAIGEFVRNVKVSNGDGISYYIRNIPCLQRDKEEYPHLILQEVSKDCEEWELILADKPSSLSIIRDELTWEFNNCRWEVIVDVGVKFNYSQQKDVLLLVVDSLAGFMEIKDGQLDIQSKDLYDFWSLKSGVFQSVCRRELIILENGSLLIT